MAIGFEISAQCYACKRGNLNGFEVHEISPDAWEVFCLDCALALELDEGK